MPAPGAWWCWPSAAAERAPEPPTASYSDEDGNQHHQDAKRADHLAALEQNCVHRHFSWLRADRAQ